MKASNAAKTQSDRRSADSRPESRDQQPKKRLMPVAPCSPSGNSYSRLTWIGGDRCLANKLGWPLVRFIHLEFAGGAVLLAATLIALIWVNSPWESSYHHLFEETHISLNVGSFIIFDDSLEHWIHEALMTIFFFVVGLEIKRELVVGELNSAALAALPVVAAIGGMVVPALIYFALNTGEPGESGWAIPMATDIAFAIGAISLLGHRVPNSLKVFLLSLAIVDDIGAISVIALFYTEDISSAWLLAAACLIAVLAILRYARVWYIPVYCTVGLLLWLAVLKSGIHATIAGVIVALFTPARPLISGSRIEKPIAREIASKDMDFSLMHKAAFEIRERVSVAHRLQDLLHPWTSFAVIPVFALASAGVSLDLQSMETARSSPITMGIIAGLVFGKIGGITLFTWLGVRSGLCRLPQGVNWYKVAGISALAGIGFTVSLFVAKLEFGSEQIITEAKIGILIASLLAAAIGIATLLLAHRASESGGEPHGSEDGSGVELEGAASTTGH